jgi:hypothetical protein
MPQVGLPRLPYKALPNAGTTCAYLSLSALVIRLSHLPGKPMGEPFVRGTTGVSVGT